MKNRLSKILAHCGVASRRKCEDLIVKGLVQVNRKTINEPQFIADLKKDLITYNGVKIKSRSQNIYYILNKPLGFVCTNEAFNAPKRVIDLLPKETRLFTVGRLDKNTSGLLIVTNDGQLAQKIIHPSNDIQKEYLVKTDLEPSSEQLERIRNGVTIDKTLIQPHKVVKVRRNTLKITVLEGKKHEVRKLIMQAGLQVQELSRIRIGHLHLGKLEMGEYKKVSAQDLEVIFTGI